MKTPDLQSEGRARRDEVAVLRLAVIARADHLASIELVLAVAIASIQIHPTGARLWRAHRQAILPQRQCGTEALIRGHHRGRDQLPQHIALSRSPVDEHAADLGHLVHSSTLRPHGQKAIGHGDGHTEVVAVLAGRLRNKLLALHPARPGAFEDIG